MSKCAHRHLCLVPQTNKNGFTLEFVLQKHLAVLLFLIYSQTVKRNFR